MRSGHCSPREPLAPQVKYKGPTDVRNIAFEQHLNERAQQESRDMVSANVAKVPAQL